MQDVRAEKGRVKTAKRSALFVLFWCVLIYFALIPTKIAFACTDLPVRIAGPNPTCYSTLQDAYDAAMDGDLIEIKSSTTFHENLDANRDISITLQGGYNSDYSAVVDVAFVKAMITTSSGTVTVADVLITATPVVRLTSPTTELTNISTPLLTYTVNEGAVVVTVDGQVVSKVSGDNLDALADGLHTVRVTATDSEGDWDSAQVSFAVDTIPPSGSILINNGATYTNSLSSALTLTATDINGVTQVQFSNDGATWSNPEAYVATKTWPLSDSDGVKTVYVKYKDAAGNWSMAHSDTIVLDRVPPTGLITINNNAAVTKSPAVILALSAADDRSGVGFIQISNDGTTWTTDLYATAKVWSLTQGDGVKSVYVKFIDNAGNTSSPFTATIILDTTPPSVTITSPSPGVTNDDTPLLSYAVSDGTVVVKLNGKIYTIANGNSFGLLPDGPHTVRVESTDIAGNTGFAQVSFTVDTAPTGGADPDASDVHCNGTEKFVVGTSAFTSGMILPDAGTNDILIDTPVDDSTIDGPKTIVKGSIDTTIPVNKVIVQVSSPNGDTTSYAAKVNGNYFAAKASLVTAGTNTITAVSYDRDGGQHQATVSVYANVPSNSVALSASPNTGIPTVQQNGQTGFDAVLQADPTLPNAATSYTWDFDGAGSNDLKCHTHSSIGAEYQQTGLYLTQVTVTDTTGNRYSDTVIVNVLDAAQMTGILQPIWDDTRTALANSDIPAALSNISENAKATYQANFDLLRDYLPQIAQDMGDVTLKRMDDNSAEMELLKTVEGVQKSYHVEFIRAEDGSWKLNFF